MRKGHTAGVNECMWHIACVCVCVVVLFGVCEAAMKGEARDPQTA